MSAEDQTDPKKSAKVDGSEPDQPSKANGSQAGDTPLESRATENEQAQDTSDFIENPANADNSDDLDFGDARMEPDAAEAADLDIELDVPTLKAKLAEAIIRADDNWDRVLRMQADMENQRKRMQKDVESARKFALEPVINDLLPVKDSLEMGLAAASEADIDPAKIIEGTDLTLKMLGQTFEKHNIVEISPLDEKFDPEFHQAMSMQEVEGKEANTVTSVLQKGYTLNNRLIRPALVMVAK